MEEVKVIAGGGGGRGEGGDKMGKKKFFKENSREGESILCDWLWRDSIPCIFSHPDTIIIPREYAATLVVIPVYIV